MHSVVRIGPLFVILLSSLAHASQPPELSGIETSVANQFNQLRQKAGLTPLIVRRDLRLQMEACSIQIKGPLRECLACALGAWEHANGDRFSKLRKITQPCLVVNGVCDNMIPVRNSYMLSENLPNAMLLTYPDAGHGSLFQFHGSFVKQASQFLDSDNIS